MNSNEKITPSNPSSRRKFVWGVGAFSLVTAVSAVVKFPFSSVKNVFAGKTANKNKTIKMLTQDGRLVEVDQSLITANRKKVTNNELLNWIKKIK
jgi:phage terminase large subunit-like protein